MSKMDYKKEIIAMLERIQNEQFIEIIYGLIKYFADK